MIKKQNLAPKEYYHQLKDLCAKYENELKEVSKENQQINNKINEQVKKKHSVQSDKKQTNIPIKKEKDQNQEKTKPKFTKKKEENKQATEKINKYLLKKKEFLKDPNSTISKVFLVDKERLKLNKEIDNINEEIQSLNEDLEEKNQIIKHMDSLKTNLVQTILRQTENLLYEFTIGAFPCHNYGFDGSLSISTRRIFYKSQNKKIQSIIIDVSSIREIQTFNFSNETYGMKLSYIHRSSQIHQYFSNFKSIESRDDCIFTIHIVGLTLENQIKIYEDKNGNDRIKSSTTGWIVLEPIADFEIIQTEDKLVNLLSDDSLSTESFDSDDWTKI
ncbi:tnfaip3-interacting protein coiled coil family member [Anaeramoeba flamelloides]|uniref:Tnfaip3-interacting protein coiled coil family member n=1 Tax=Anaeramoeba flamelloides TaxID=1746091 RepID=A0AAV7YFQ9_9EUKA|nr:tnfaip3-interacting protein coiled coil family member [Anaeramoeba flamelloides]